MATITVTPDGMPSTILLAEQLNLLQLDDERYAVGFLERLADAVRNADEAERSRQRWLAAR